MYLATEGLYAQIISSKTGIAEALQAQGIMVAGPSTVTALLNSLAMGFKTVAINKKANEVYKVLGAAKAQYDKFGIVLAKARKKVEEAGKTLEDAESRNRIIQKNLKSVESLSADKADQILGLEFEMKNDLPKRKPNRLKIFDYSSDGAYFITRHGLSTLSTV